MPAVNSVPIIQGSVDPKKEAAAAALAQLASAYPELLKFHLPPPTVTNLPPNAHQAAIPVATYASTTQNSTAATTSPPGAIIDHQMSYENQHQFHVATTQTTTNTTTPTHVPTAQAYNHTGHPVAPPTPRQALYQSGFLSTDAAANDGVAPYNPNWHVKSPPRY